MSFHNPWGSLRERGVVGGDGYLCWIMLLVGMEVKNRSGDPNSGSSFWELVLVGVRGGGSGWFSGVR